VQFHEDHEAPATMSVSQYHFTVPYGVVETDQQFMTGIEEKPVIRFSVNAGIYVIGPETIDLVPGDRACDMPELFDLLLKRAERGEGHRPAVFPLHEYEYWIDIGQHDDLNRARRDFRGLLRQE
jgi:NDP-sugar pyrophosphorylase family protein